MNNKGIEQNALMCRLVYAIVVRMQQSQIFSLRGPFVVVLSGKSQLDTSNVYPQYVFDLRKK